MAVNVGDDCPWFSPEAEGEGYTVNIPWEVAANAKNPPADAEMLYAFDRLVMPYLDFYGPWPGARYDMAGRGVGNDIILYVRYT